MNCKVIFVASVLSSSACILPVFGFSNGAIPQDAPRFESEIPSPEDASDDYKRTQEDLEHLNFCAPKPHNDCKKRPPYELVPEPQRMDFSPYKLTADPKKMDLEWMSPEMSFAPLKEVRKDQVQKFKKALSTNKPFHCDKYHCLFARYGFDPEDTDNSGTKVILGCSYIKLARKEYSAPACGPVIIEDSVAGTWVLSVVGYSRSSLGSPQLGEPEVGAFPVGMIGKLPKHEPVAKAVLDALVEPIMGLTPRNNPLQNKILAGTSGRASPILPTYREQSTVSIDIQNNGSFIGFWIEIILYVNRYNTNEWRKPDKTQEEQYRVAVQDALVQRLKLTCKSSPEPSNKKYVITCY